MSKLGISSEAKSLQGTEKDDVKNLGYCMYGYEEGEFTQEMTMGEMDAHCLQYVDDFNKNTNQKLSKEEAVRKMVNLFPALKKWRKNRIALVDNYFSFR